MQVRVTRNEREVEQRDCRMQYKSWDKVNTATDGAEDSGSRSKSCDSFRYQSEQLAQCM